MLSAGQLLNSTRIYKRGILKNADNVAVRFISCTAEKDSDGDDYREVIAYCIGDTEPRECLLQFVGPLNNTAKMWATCSCPWWLYVCEVAVERKDSTDIIYSNGATPKVTNKSMHPMLCKHLCACLNKGAAMIKPGSIRKK